MSGLAIALCVVVYVAITVALFFLSIFLGVHFGGPSFRHASDEVMPVLFFACAIWPIILPIVVIVVAFAISSTWLYNKAVELSESIKERKSFSQ